jgi:hypothetical protein
MNGKPRNAMQGVRLTAVTGAGKADSAIAWNPAPSLSTHRATAERIDLHRDTAIGNDAAPEG